MTRRAKGEGSLIRRKGCAFFYAQYYVDGRQVRVSTKRSVKQQALAELRRLMGERDRGIAPVDKHLSYGDIRAGLLASYIEKGNRSLRIQADGSETTVGLNRLDEFCGFTDGKAGVPVSRITTDFARAFVRKRQEEGMAAATINRSLAALQRMLNIAKEDGKIQVVPKIRLLKEASPRTGFLERTKFNELLGALPEHLRPLITFLYWCGGRVGEAEQIEWPQVDLDRALIEFEREQTKTGEKRTVPLPDVLVDMLRRIEPKTGRVFDATNRRKEWYTACAAVGLGMLEKRTSADGNRWEHYHGLMIHDLRRSGIRNLRLAGVPETVAMKISGHVTRTIFDRYNIVSIEDVSAAMRAVESSALVSAKLVQTERGNRRKSFSA